MSQSPPAICLLGAPIGIGNRGVSALGVSTARLCWRVHREATVCLLIGNRDSEPKKLCVDGIDREIPVVNYRMSPKAPLQEQMWWILLLSGLYRLLPVSAIRQSIRSRNRWIRTVAAADLVAEIRGGDSFSDIYGLRRFLVGSLPLITVLWIRGEAALLPQTYGPYRARLARWFARWVLGRASTLLSRDQAGVKEVHALTHGQRDADFCPDVAFALESRRPPRLEAEPELQSKPGETLVGLNVNGLMYNGGYTRDNMFGLRLDYRRFLELCARQLLEQPAVRLLLVPHTFAPPSSVESDPHACRLVRDSLPEPLRSRVHLVTGTYDQNEIKGVIGRCDFFIGSRMHACIAALSQSIPAVGVAYSRKFAGVFESVGAESWVVDGRDTDAEAAVARVAELFSQRDRLRPLLQQRVAAAQSRLGSVFAEMLSRLPRRA